VNITLENDLDGAMFMTKAKAKIINILLGDGTLDGLVTVEDSSWEGILLIAPREKIAELFLQEETKYWGVYILVSTDEVYIGQASELQKRIKQHSAGFEFWQKAILITTKDDSLNKSAIDYIEFDLIEKAKMKSALHSENKKSGNMQKVNRFEKVKLDNFIENTLLLLELLGIFVFTSSTFNRKKKQGLRVTTSNYKKDQTVPQPSVVSEQSVPYQKNNTLDESLKIGKYVQSIMQKLSDRGYVFTDFQINQLTSLEWCRDNFGLGHPLLKIKTGEPNERNDSKGYSRYYKNTYVFGNVEYYLTSELYERGNERSKFRDWYQSL